MPPILVARDLAKSFGTRSLFTSVALSLETRERLALIGPNGSGKSTLLKLLAGMETADAGSVTLTRGVRIAYVSQKDEFPEGSTIHSAVLSALKDAMARGQAPALHDEHEAELAATMTLDRLGIDEHERKTATLSGGQRKRVAIARELAKEPDALLLDEPTNHLDVEGIEWLEETLRSTGIASIIVTHDRDFLENVATRIVELSRAYPQGTFSVQGDYSEFLRRKQEFLDGQAAQEQSLANQVREDLRWLSRGAKARRTKSKSRIEASHDRMDELAELRARNAPQRAAAIEFGATGRQSQKLLQARAITKNLGGKRLFTDLDIVLAPKSVLGLLGPNGSGKTSLIRVLMKQLPPDEPTPEAIRDAKDTQLPPSAPPVGTVQHAEKLRVVLFSQHRTEFDPGTTLRDAMSPHSDAVIYNDRTIHVNSWAKRFLFTPEQLKQPLRALSGGEQARVHIARLMLEPADVLILDEPTNDLDIPSLEVLEESIEEFPGAVVLVTHDRAMLARLATTIVALDGKGNARRFAEYDQWLRWHEAEKNEQPAVEVAKPAPVTAPAAPKKAKLSYKEQQELANMEKAIEQAESLARELDAQMADPSVMADAKRFQDVCTRSGDAHAKVAQLYERWSELEGKRG
ncbi:MAG TPA: ABC-F family ATP-binding cassette domain-containing protein [Phycisphaerales bacterium]|nr:ABC-F family ATP-binding cassette domain-containing protein [Phycisphaerales bacterium]